MKKLNLPFYLTGGTALGRYYFFHRYSDDLDLFVNNDVKFSKYVQSLFSGFEKEQAKGGFDIDYERIRKTENFSQFFLSKASDNSLKLKIDLVNDIAAHYGEFEWHDKLGKIDSWRNILSNKVSCIFRNEAKDLVDIWEISKNCTFQWREIISEAKTKEAGVDPIVIYNIIKSFPSHLLSSIKFTRSIQEDLFVRDISTIANDILLGNKNSLAKISKSSFS